MATVPPSSISGLKAFSPNFSTKLTALATAVGCSSSDATSYAALNTDFLAKAAVCDNPSTRTKVTVDELRISRGALLLKLRQLCKVINAFPGTTDPLRISFGLKPKDVVPSPAPIPVSRPELAVDAYGNLRLVNEATPSRRGKPSGSVGAVVITAIRDADEPAPTTPDGGTYCGLATTKHFTIPLPPGSGGRMLYAMAFYVNHRGEPGPVSAIVATRIAA